MPSRPMIALIVLFWLGVACWYVLREVAPRWGVDNAPPFHIDLTDEVGRPSIDWDVLSKGKRIGDLTTKVQRLDANRFELGGVFRSTQLQVFNIEIRKIEVSYRVTPEGKLLEADMHLLARAGFDIDLAMHGAVEEGILKPEFSINDQAIPTSMIQGLRLPPGGSILNTMLPLNRIPRLAEGRRWSVPMIDAVGEVKNWLSRDVAISEVHAEVVLDTLHWNEVEVPCFKIEYREPGRRRLKASTWVRRVDGLVLQQEANHEQMDLVMVRRPTGLFE